MIAVRQSVLEPCHFQDAFAKLRELDAHRPACIGNEGELRHARYRIDFDAYGFSSSLSIMSTRATPLQPQAVKVLTARSCISFVFSGDTRAGMMCVEAPFVYLLS